MSKFTDPLRLNVGFITKQPVGYSRDFSFNYQELTIPPDLSVNDLKGKAEISRTPQGLLVQVTLVASVSATCVRCLNVFSLQLHSEFTELYAFSERSTSESGLILPKDGHINLSPLAREYLLLDFPISPICRPDCISLCPICGEDQNEKICNHTELNIDPRLEKLKSFLK